MKYIFFLTFMIAVSNSVSAQFSQKFIVTEHSVGENNYDSLAIENGITLMLSQESDSSDVYFTNLWTAAETYSYGKINIIHYDEYDETIDSNPGSLLLFDWFYSNSYDENKGKAKVVLTIYSVNEKMYFKCEIFVLETNETLSYTGYLV